MTSARTALAWRIVDGLAGYFQYVNASRLLDIPGEDTAQFVMCQVLQAQQRYRVAVSAKPPNWSGRERVDAGLLPKSSGAVGWYGVVEVKWVTRNRESARVLITQDCARVASVDTSNLNAKLVVVGFTDDMMQDVFDKKHPTSKTAEAQRVLLSRLLPRAVGTAASVAHADIAAAFPTYMEDTPTKARFTRGVKVELLAKRTIASEAGDIGHVLAWQVNQRRGRIPSPS